MHSFFGDRIFDGRLGGFVGFTLHFIIHIGQSVVMKQYISALATSVICLPILAYTVKKVKK